MAPKPGEASSDDDQYPLQTFDDIQRWNTKPQCSQRSAVWETMSTSQLELVDSTGNACCLTGNSRRELARS